MKRACAVCILLSTLFISQLFAQQPNDDWVVLGVTRFDGKTGSAKTYTQTFTVPILKPLSFTLQLVNGDGDGKNRVTNATVKLNGVTVISPTECNQQTAILTKEVTTQSSNTLQITVNGKTGSFLTITCLKHLFPIHPIVECVQKNPNGTYTAHFGYSNDNTYAVTVPVGLLNLFIPPPIDRSQPTVFQPGRQQNVFSVVFNGKPLVWEVRGRITTATNSPSLACGGADTIPPAMSITSPVDGMITSAASVQVSGTASDASPVTVTINGSAVTVDPSGAFTGTVTLTEGLNTITIVARDAAGNQTTITRKVTRDSVPPTLIVTTPTDSTITNQINVTLSGTVTDVSATTLTVNGSPVQVGTGGVFSYQLSVTEGLNTITVVATDAAGNKTTVTRKVRRDTQSPIVSLTSPIDSLLTNQLNVTVSGTVKDSTAVSLTINGNSVSIDVNGAFNTTMNLIEGLNTITVVATDVAGNKTTVTRKVRKDTQAPIVSLTSPIDSLLTNQLSITVSGTVVDSTAVTLTINGTSVSIGVGGVFSSQLVIVEGLNTITVIATDAAGNKTTVTRKVRRDTQAPIVSLSSPIDSLITNLPSVIVSGTVKDSTTVALTINGTSVPVGVNGTFSYVAPLVEGLNTITVIATDAVGNKTTVARKVRRDTQSPIVNLTSPIDSLITKQQIVNVSGTVTDSTAVTLMINGNSVPIGAGGAFSYNLAIVEGLNTITVVATDAAGNKTTVTRKVRRDTQSPIVHLTSPIDSLITNQQLVNVSGTVIDSTAVTVTVKVGSGTPFQLQVGTDGTFSSQLALVEGLNTITVVATDAAGNQSTVVRHVSVHTILPVLIVTAPIDSVITNIIQITVRGTVSSQFPVTLTVNGVPVSVGLDSTFSTQVILQEGINTITAVATDAVGNQTTVTRKVRRDTQSPVVHLTSPIDSLITNQLNITVSGTVTDSTVVTLTINGSNILIGIGGAFSCVVPIVEGLNAITVVATDAVGNKTTVIRKVRRDAQSPVVNLQSPTDNLITNLPSVTVSGTVIDSTAITLKVNGTIVPINIDGSFSYVASLVAGANMLTIIATDAAGNSITQIRTVSYQSITVPFVITSPIDGYITNTGEFNIEGKIIGDTIQRLYVSYDENEWDITWDENGNFQLPFSLWDWNVKNTIIINAVSVSGTTYSKTVHILFDSDPPSISTSLKETTFTNKPTITITGTAEDLTSVTLTVNGKSVPVDTAGKFVCVVSLPLEYNEITFIATDAMQQSSDLSLTIIRDTIPPAISLISPKDGDTTRTGGVWVEGNVQDASQTVVNINDEIRRPGSDGRFRYFVMLSSNENQIRVKAIDGVGNESVPVVRTIVNQSQNYLPPDPSSVATPINRTVPTILSTSTAFLYTGSNPVQIGVDSATIDPVRAAVLRGVVVNTSGQPLPGVQVTIFDHPEFGVTFSRTNGEYDMAVNGEGALIMKYTKQEYFQVQRQIDVPWQNFVIADSIVMTALDQAVTKIDFSNPIQVAQGSIATDKDGPRQATLMFKQGTHAVMKKVNYAYQTVNENGIVRTIKTVIDTTETPLDSLHIRATEYTVGSLGPNAMPAKLPPSTAYTYCVELSADEANSVSGSSITFSKPVPFYVDNFLNLPAGSAVPVGYYDRDRGVWIPCPDGIILKIVSVTNGLADIDLTGDDIPEPKDSLIAFGFSEEELQKLGQMYSPGKSLWRAEIAHFSPCDLNFFIRMLEALLMNLDITNPNFPLSPCSSTMGGSIIRTQDQTLGEVLPIAGTPVALSYQSDRVPGDIRQNTITIPLIDSVSFKYITQLNVNRIDLTIEIAGRVFKRSFEPDTNLSYSFTWDGKDVYGRVLQGQQLYKVRTDYVVQEWMMIWTYPYYYGGNQGNINIVGYSFGGPPERIDTPSFYIARWDVQKYPKEYFGTLGAFDASPLGLGKWGLNLQHFFDPKGKTLYMGDGNKRDMRVAGPNITKVMPIDTISEPANASSAYGGAFAIGSDGSQYYFNGSDYYIYKTDRFGKTTIIAGTGEYGGGGGGIAGSIRTANSSAKTSISAKVSGSVKANVSAKASNSVQTNSSTQTGNGDGGPALEAKIGNVGKILVGNDGTIYFSQNDTNNHAQIRCITQDGTITTIAAVDSTLITGRENDPNKPVLASGGPMALGPDGSLFICDGNGNIVKRLGTDGILRTYAGQIDQLGSRDDGILATHANIYPCDIQVGKDGSLYILENWDFITNSDPGYFDLRKVSPDGIIRTIAGSPGTFIDYGYNYLWLDDGDGGPALNAHLGYVWNLAIGPDGTLYVYENYPHQWVRSISPNGIINTIAGLSSKSEYYRPESGDGGPALQASIPSPDFLTGGPDGALYTGRGYYKYDYSTQTKTNSYLYVRKIEKANFWNVPTQFASEDGSQLYIFDSEGKHVRTDDALTGIPFVRLLHDSTGLLLKVIDRDSLVTTIQRDMSGNLVSIISPYGQRTSFTMDSCGSLASVTNPAGETTHYEYTPDGLMTSLKDPKGNMHSFIFDSTGALTQDIDPVGGYTLLSKTKITGGYTVRATTAMGETNDYTVKQLPIGCTQQINTSAAGLQTITTFGLDGVTTKVTPDGTTTKFTDGPDPRFGMMSPINTNTTASLPSGLTSVTTEQRTITQISGTEVTGMTTEINVNGRSSQSIWDGSQKMFTSISPEGRQRFSWIDSKDHIIKDSIPGIAATNYTYDSQGKLTGVSQSERVTSYEYDQKGYLVSSTDPLKHTSRFEYDSVGRMTRQVLPDSHEILYTYDANGNLTSLTPPLKPAHLFDYTKVDLTDKYTPPILGIDTIATLYTYDLDKRQTVIHLPNGDSITTVYDVPGCGCGGTITRPKQILFDRGSLNFKYDQFTGQLDTLIAPTDTTTYSYNGSLLTSASKGSANLQHLNYFYDDNFRVTDQELWVPNPNSDDFDRTVEYGYDQDGLVTSISTYDNSWNMVAPPMNITYDPTNGLPVSTSLGNMYTGQTYNEKGELDSYEADYNSSATFQTSYQRDSLGRIAQLTETIQGQQKKLNYSYDIAGRLWQVWRNDTLVSTYSYDPNGNRISHWTPTKVDSGSYDAQDRMLSYSTAQYLYTPNGELRLKVESSDTTHYTYDNFGNLVNVRLPNGDLIEYLIDGQNRRIGKKVNGQIIKRWIYSGQLSPVAELDSGGNVVSQFVGGYMIKNDTTYQLITDHLGSVRLVVDVATDMVMQKLEYDEFGNVTQNTNPDFQPFAYAGGLYDIQTKLVRFGARDYDTKTGRWTKKDPTGFGGGASNLFEYTVNDPVNRTDPFGLQTIFIAVQGDLTGIEGGQGAAGIVFNLGHPSQSGLFGSIGFAGGANVGIGVGGGFTLRDINGTSGNIDVNAFDVSGTAMFDGTGFNGGTIAFGPGLGASTSITQTGTLTFGDIIGAFKNALRDLREMFGVPKNKPCPKK
jgi:RHS repeat-associated protein